MENNQIEIVYVLNSKTSKRKRPFVTFEWTNGRSRSFYPTRASNVRLAQLLLKLARTEEWSMMTNNGYAIASRVGVQNHY